MDCKSINPNLLLTVRIYKTPAGYCWFPVRDRLEGDDFFVGTKAQIAEKIKQLNKADGLNDGK